MIDFEINRETGDLYFPLQSVQGINLAHQELVARLRFYRGEYFLDSRVGVPYLDGMIAKGGSRSVLEAEIKKAIFESPYVESLDYFLLQFNSIDRDLTVTFRAQTTEGLIAISINI